MNDFKPCVFGCLTFVIFILLFAMIIPMALSFLR